MDTNALKRFAQGARNLLIDQVSARLDMVLAEGAAARREHPKAIAKLETAASRNRQQVIEQAAYTWFNRFTALRFMDVTGLTNPRVVSPANGATRPELLAEAMAGNLPDRVRPEIAEYLNGTRPAHDGQAEAYRLLLIHACNEWHGIMPYMFERADMLDRAEDYTELLMPDDLLSPASILARLREVMTEEACQDVEIIGWLYQFYISEKKDEVFAGLKKNKKITAENIPAATQLFTPHWIVRYLVENSLGRLWLLNRPQSKLAAKMDYYIAPEEPEMDFLKISRAEEINICDPACGSGHMLTYAFDLLYEIYAEEGHDAAEIPGLILKHNLTGIEIDDRAGALAAFALSMKAAAKLGRRRFLRMEAKPDIVVLQDVRFTPAEMQDVAAVVGKDLFTDELRETLGQFEQAKNFGSLIVPKLRDPAETLRIVEARDFGSDLLLKEVQARVVAVLRMAEALSPSYHVVVANPPYMGSSGMNKPLLERLGSGYTFAKADLFSAFIVRIKELCKNSGYMALMTPTTWMFISTHKKLRQFILNNTSFTSLIQMEYNSGLIGAIAPVCAYSLKVGSNQSNDATFISLKNFKGYEKQAIYAKQAIDDPTCDWRFKRGKKHFESLQNVEIAYDIPDGFAKSLSSGATLGSQIIASEGLKTAENTKFIRFWHEVSSSELGIYGENKTWMRHAKGGDFRLWYGNLNWAVRWNGPESVQYEPRAGFQGRENYGAKGVVWSKISNAFFAARLQPDGLIFDSACPGAFATTQLSAESLLALLCSKTSQEFIKKINPTMNFQVGNVLSVPLPLSFDWEPYARTQAERIITIAKSDWDAYETSWDFTTLPLLALDHRSDTLVKTYADLRTHWQSMTDEMQRLEEENNRIFIDAYGLADELTPEVPIEEITLTCNPAYRYGVKGTKQERETRLREDTMAEFLHYAVGCMFGRYSLDEPGLILADQGEGVEEYLDHVPEPTFSPNADNVIPVLDADWFADDIVTRAHEFLRVTFGKEYFRENLAFIETALGKDLRKWFTKDFYDYHVRRYKKRPIYWMFSSPKGSFNALIYMHRYRPDTVSVVLNQYLREFIHKLAVERARLEKLADDPGATQSARTRAQKDIGTVIKQITELTEWERDVVYPMAQQKVTIDLDDGVKHNYPLFAGALKPIKGLEAAADD